MAAQAECGLELFSIMEMAAADQAAIKGGVPFEILMRRAGAAVANAILARWSQRPVLVMAGPGHNGGDGLVAAARLKAWGWPVTLAGFGRKPADVALDAAALDAALWDGQLMPLTAELVTAACASGPMIIIDGLLGAGLSRPLAGDIAAIFEAVADARHRRRCAVVAIDVPSGVDGDSGAVCGVALEVDLTVAFHRPRLGHYLLPGRRLRGALQIADIGIGGDAPLGANGCQARLNHPALWSGLLPKRREEGHKFQYGHTLVCAGPMMGAAILVAQAARRAGAGLVSIASGNPQMAMVLAQAPGLMLHGEEAVSDGETLGARRFDSLVIGPGGGRSPALQTQLLARLSTARALVIDADGLTVFAGQAERLAAGLLAAGLAAGQTVITPHEGEFARLFPDIDRATSKPRRARTAARRLGAVVVLKGPDTVVASPDGRVIVHGESPANLATAGSGDVLAGLIAGLLAQGMEGFLAAAAAVWLHAQAARLACPTCPSCPDGALPGLLAEDLLDHIIHARAKL